MSINIDNGYTTLREALKQSKADIGIMIVPWTPKKSGQADESIGIDRLDSLSEDINGKYPIIRLAVIRKLDIINIIKNQWQVKNSRRILRKKTTI